VRNGANAWEKTFSATLEGDTKNPTEISYSWRYNEGTMMDKKVPGNTSTVTIVFNKKPTAGLYIVYCDVTYKNNDLLCTAKSGSVTVTTPGVPEVCSEKASVLITSARDTINPKRATFTAELKDEVNPVGITYSWRYKENNGADVIPRNNTGPKVTIDFPNKDADYTVYCDVNYKKGTQACSKSGQVLHRPGGKLVTIALRKAPPKVTRGGGCKSCIADDLENPTMGVETVNKKIPYEPFALGPLPIAVSRPPPRPIAATPRAVCGITGVTITDKKDAANSLKTVFKATLTGDTNNPTNITYNWSYHNEGSTSDGKILEPPDNNKQEVLITFPRSGTYVVHCDVTYKNGDLICLPTPPFGTFNIIVKESPVARPPTPAPTPPMPAPTPPTPAPTPPTPAPMPPTPAPTPASRSPTPPPTPRPFFVNDDDLLPARPGPRPTSRPGSRPGSRSPTPPRPGPRPLPPVPIARPSRTVEETKKKIKNSGKLANILAKKRAEEGKRRVVSPKPKTLKEIKPLDTTGKTFDAIFEQLKRGNGAKQLDTISNDIAEYGSDEIDNAPISQFIDKYKMVSAIFGRLGSTSSQYAEGGALVQNQAHYKEIIDRIWLTGEKFQWHGNPHSKDHSGDIYNYIRQFFFDFIKCYVLQYSYGGKTIAEKADFLFDEFKEFIGDIHLKKFDGSGDCKITLFQTLGITKEQVTEYIMAWNPDEPNQFFATKNNPNGMPSTLAAKPETQIKRDKCS